MRLFALVAFCMLSLNVFASADTDDSDDVPAMSAEYIEKIQAHTNTIAEMGALEATDRWVRTELAALLKTPGLTEAERDAFIAETAETMETVDQINADRLKDLLKRHDWAELVEIDAELTAQMLRVVTHASHDNQWRKDVLEEIKPLVEAGKISGGRYATSYDKTLIADDKPQIYGTQLKCIEGAWAPIDLADPDTVDARREAMGLESMEQNIAINEQLYGACPPVTLEKEPEAED